MLVASLTTSPARAAAFGAGCTTTGADGFIYVPSFNQPVTSLALEWHIEDILADGPHARIRFLSKESNGTIRSWPWHSALGGKGDHEYASTTATDSNGIF